MCYVGVLMLKCASHAPIQTSVHGLKSMTTQEDEPQAEDVAMVGTLFLVDKNIDKASARTPVPLRKMAEPKPFHLAVMDDPIIKKLASQGKANIFTTDIALAVLMSAPRSVNSVRGLHQCECRDIVVRAVPQLSHQSSVRACLLCACTVHITHTWLSYGEKQNITEGSTSLWQTTSATMHALFILQ
jgi:hypothetical protein